MTKDELLETLPLCRNCLYFYADHDGRDIGLCCRRAPQPLIVNARAENVDASGVVVLHPPVLATQFCGEGVRNPNKFGPCDKCRHFDPSGDPGGLNLPSLVCKKGCSPRSCQCFEAIAGDDVGTDVYQD